MFAIYNMQGRAFRDSLEALKKVRQPHSVADSQLQEDVAKDETIIIQGKDSPESLANANSVNAYRKMLHANERTVIVHAYQIMTHPVATLSSQITVAQAYTDFEKQQVNQFPVYTPQMALIGMVTRLEVIQAYYENPNQPLESLISGDVITADPVSDVRRIAKAMHEYQLSALPIVDNEDRLVGIISKSDLVKALIKEPPVSLWA